MEGRRAGGSQSGETRAGAGKPLRRTSADPSVWAPTSVCLPHTWSLPAPGARRSCIPQFPGTQLHHGRPCRDWGTLRRAPSPILQRGRPCSPGEDKAGSQALPWNLVRRHTRPLGPPARGNVVARTELLSPGHDPVPGAAVTTQLLCAGLSCRPTVGPERCHVGFRGLSPRVRWSAAAPATTSSPASLCL